jgi:eukaryotic-like serine/threonine-protein kinase
VILDVQTQIVAVPARAPQIRESRNLLGRTLGRFKIVELLGCGGSGEVFRADDLGLGRSAVIKVLREETRATGHYLERFVREIQLAARLDHPYAAHIYGFGVEPDHLIWVAMEHVRGVTLESLVNERGPMQPAMFAPLFARLCEVVHSAHERGIVHRDIKGNNVMVIERSGQLLPKLLDFGIAKVLTEDTEAAPLHPRPGGDCDVDGLTLEGAVMGTPLFMAPEQWQSAATVDGRADIYALGVLAYVCLSGRYPFDHGSRAALHRAHTSEPPPPLEHVPAPLAAAVERALAKSRDERWPDALAFADAIRHAMEATWLLAAVMATAVTDRRSLEAAPAVAAGLLGTPDSSG